MLHFLSTVLSLVAHLSSIIFLHIVGLDMIAWPYVVKTCFLLTLKTSSPASMLNILGIEFILCLYSTHLCWQYAQLNLCPKLSSNRPSESLGILIATFLAISLLFFFASFFDAFLGGSWLRFPSQLGSQNRSKSQKNRCQDAIHLGLRFLIHFWSVLASNFYPRKPTKR